MGLTLAAGGTLKQAFIAGALAFAQVGLPQGGGGLWTAVGDAVAGSGTGLAGTIATHAIVGGALSVAQGGSFTSGLASGAFSAAAGGIAGGLGINNSALRVAIGAVVGGTASVLSGGKFANGAITAAFATIYNDLAHIAMAGAEVGVGMVPGVGEAQDLYVLGHPSSSLFERGLAGVSLVANVLTGGLLPNAGGFIRAAGHLCSFEGDTKVETKRGRIAIKDVRPGEDEVVSRNEKTGETSYKLVSARFVHRDGNTTRLTLKDRATYEMQTITTTANHPFFVDEIAIPEVRMVANGGVAVAGTVATGRWSRADGLKPGDKLVNADGAYSEVVRVAVEETEQDAYNLSVDDFHTFFVAAPGNDNAPAVWVHNACPNFIVRANGDTVIVPSGAIGPHPTRASGFQYTGGSGGNGLDARVTGVRIMDANSNQGARAVYMNRTGQTVDPASGRTVPNSDPRAHQYFRP